MDCALLTINIDLIIYSLHIYENICVEKNIIIFLEDIFVLNYFIEFVMSITCANANSINSRFKIFKESYNIRVLIYENVSHLD